jgi:formylglycine-generating enzyme required for sulfatase activity
MNGKTLQIRGLVGTVFTCVIACAFACLGAVLLLTIFFVLMTNLNHSSDQIVEIPEYSWVTIPAGQFQMGSENGDTDEKPVHTVYVDQFEIGKYEITNDQYTQCVNAGICLVRKNGVNGEIGDDEGLYPVAFVTWYDANDYCKWVGGRLPTEAEWEKAARGTDQRLFSWGEDISCDKANYGACGVGGTTPVGSYESGKSPYGLYDMVGNIAEWTSSLHQPYPYDENDGREDLNSSDYRVVRGGSWEDMAYYVRSAGRYGVNSGAANFGFRCARDSVDVPTSITFK